MIADISVIIPYYNAENTILRALESIKRQTIAVKEVIIINDGSNFEHLQEICKNLNNDLNIVLINLGSNFGASHARNTGVAHATGTFLAFLDADDAWHPDKISIQYEFMRHSNAFLSCHGYVFNLNQKSMDEPTPQTIISKHELTKYSYILRNPICTPTVMVRRSGFIDFDIRLSRSEDLKCWVDNLENGAAFSLKTKLAGGYKNPVGESGLSGSYYLMHKGWIEAWTLLYNENKIGRFPYLVTIYFEYFKYYVRILRKHLNHSKSQLRS